MRGITIGIYVAAGVALLLSGTALGWGAKSYEVQWRTVRRASDLVAGDAAVVEARAKELLARADVVYGAISELASGCTGPGALIAPPEVEMALINAVYSSRFYWEPEIESNIKRWWALGSKSDADARVGEAYVSLLERDLRSSIGALRILSRPPCAGEDPEMVAHLTRLFAFCLYGEGPDDESEGQSLVDLRRAFRERYARVPDYW